MKTTAAEILREYGGFPGANHVHGCQPPLLDGLRRKLQKAREVVYIPGVAIGVQLLAADACAEVYLDFLASVDGASR